jgi:NADH dehydrogenase FAD-containing subunit
MQAHRCGALRPRRAIRRSSHLLTPLLPQVAVAPLRQSQIPHPHPGGLRTVAELRRRQAAVTGANRNRRDVDLRYDNLRLATGAVNGYFANASLVRDERVLRTVDPLAEPSTDARRDVRKSTT